MPVPPPIPDPTHIETRLLIVADMLDLAVAEVRRTLSELRADTRQPTVEPDQPGDADA